MGSDAELRVAASGAPADTKKAADLKPEAAAPQRAGPAARQRRQAPEGPRLVYAVDRAGRDSFVPLFERPDASAQPVFRLPPGVVAEVTADPATGADEAGGACWVLVAPGELARFGAPSDRELWLRVDGQIVQWVGGRVGDEGPVWFEPSALPQSEDAPQQLVAKDPLEADYPLPEGGPGTLPLDALTETLTEEALRRLQADGFVIVDDVLPASTRDRLRDEMEALLANDQYWESQSYGSENEGALHHSIVETTLDFKEVRSFAPTFDKMEQDQGLLRRLRLLPTLGNLRKQHVRLQVNKGNGGCYTMHTDSGVTESDSGAQVLKATALFYLNKDWREGDGGELRLFPFPGPPVKIPPLDGRLVLFEPRMVHEVLPNYRRRYCFTLWCASSDEEASRTSFLDMDLECVTGFERAVALSEDARRRMSLPRPVGDAVPAPLRALFLPEVRPIIVRYVWRECELESARQSHHDGPQKTEMLQGIGYYHEEMEAYNPRWLRHVLESLPKSSEAKGDAISAADGESLIGPGALAELVRRHCPWWE